MSNVESLLLTKGEMTASSVQIRLGRPSDAFLLSRLGMETFRETFAADNTPGNMAAYLAEAFSLEKQSRELADRASRFLIVEREGQPIAYARLRSGPAPVPVAGRHAIEIARFYVTKPWIGKGIGAKLMRRCLREAGDASSDTIWLDVWERNLRAIAFYRKWKFTEVGSQGFQLGDELQRDLLMARPVRDPSSRRSWGTER